MKEIQIIVTGKTGVGKTTISRLIKSLLQSHNFEVEIDDEDDPDINVLNSLAALKGQKLQIKIKTQQSNG